MFTDYIFLVTSGPSDSKSLFYFKLTNNRLKFDVSLQLYPGIFSILQFKTHVCYQSC